MQELMGASCMDSPYLRDIAAYLRHLRFTL
jgi:hypothetical protein